MAGQPAEADVGVRDGRGEWRPEAPVGTPPPFVRPPRPKARLRRLFGCPGHLLPWNLLFMAMTVATWLRLTPELEAICPMPTGRRAPPGASSHSA